VRGKRGEERGEAPHLAEEVAHGACGDGIGLRAAVGLLVHGVDVTNEVHTAVAPPVALTCPCQRREEGATGQEGRCSWVAGKSGEHRGEGKGFGKGAAWEGRGTEGRMAGGEQCGRGRGGGDGGDGRDIGV